MTGLTRLSLANRALVIMISVVISAVGVFAIPQLKQQLFPSLSLPMVSVITPYVGAAPDTIYLGTFSKVFAPGLRVGWISAPDHLRDDLAFVVEAMTLAPPTLNHAIVAGFFSLGDWRGLIDDYRAAYRRQAKAMTDGLAEHLGAGSDWHWDEPEGGFYVWLTHRDQAVDTRDLLPIATAAGANVSVLFSASAALTVAATDIASSASPAAVKVFLAPAICSCPATTLSGPRL